MRKLKAHADLHELFFLSSIFMWLRHQTPAEPLSDESDLLAQIQDILPRAEPLEETEAS